MDVDFAMSLEEYDLNVKKALVGNKKTPVLKIYASPKNGFEFKLKAGKFAFDLFFLTGLNSTHWWIPYHYAKKYYRHIFKRFNEYCSAELLGLKLLVACDHENIIVGDYGPGWRKPKSGGGWISMDWKNKMVFKNEDWKDRVKFYDRDGKFKEKDAIDYINRNNEGIRPVVTKIFDDID